jgi:hypothetical protein
LNYDKRIIRNSDTLIFFADLFFLLCTPKDVPLHGGSNRKMVEYRRVKFYNKVKLDWMAQEKYKGKYM